VKYLLDTNICIYIIKNKPPLVLKKLQKCRPEDVALSSVTLAELYYGVEKSQSQEKNRTALALFTSSFDVLSFEEKAAHCFGKIRATLESQGKVIGPFDMMIGAHALSLELILVTNNTKEFSRIENLKIQDWTS
jgi:tRNA(fMet)-specific endonuclease VapC